MFNKQKRINSERFKEILKSGKKIFGKNIHITYLDNNLTHSRFSIVVPKKSFKKAFLRHRIKRQVTHALKEVEVNFKPLDYILFAKESVKPLTFDEIKGELNDLSGRI